MKADKNIIGFGEEQQGISSFTRELDEKLMLGEIDLAEYEVMMSEKSASASKEIEARERIEKKNKMQIGIAGAILIVIALVSIFSQQGPFTPTGFAVGERQITQTIDYNQSFTQNDEKQLTLYNITSLKISGILEGTSATVKLRINGTEYLVAEINNPELENQITGEAIEEGTEEKIQYTISTDKTTYTLGETATITISPDTENKSLYISHGEQTQKLDSNSYTPIELGEYQAIALITLEKDILRIETNFSVTNETTPPETPEQPALEITPEQANIYEFTELCTETCILPKNSNPVLIIETDPDTTLTITQIITTQERENNAPTQVQVIPDITIKPGEETTLNLDEYFTDTDGDTVQYDINEIPGIDSTIAQNILTITSTVPGAHTGFIYATDGDKLVTSNTFQIIITEATEEPAEPVINPIINETINGTINQTTVVVLEASNACSEPDPNKRPIECLENAEYFQEQTILIENVARVPVARITPIGNLIISGEVIEQSSFTPSEGDYAVSYEDSYGNKQATVWFDSSTGNVHLKGSLYEEKISSEPYPGSFVIRNKKGIVLLWGDPVKGDMYLRGNVITYRKDIMR